MSDLDVDTYLAQLQARIPEGAAWPYDPLKTREQRRVIRIAIDARREVTRLELELRAAEARVAALLGARDA